MSRIILTSDLASQFSKAEESIELCDPSGKVLGLFVPENVSLSEIYGEPEIDEAELDRRSKVPRRYTTDEVIRYLEGL